MGSTYHYGSIFISLGYPRDRSRAGDYASLVWRPRSHIDAGESQTLRANLDMGSDRAPYSDPGMVGRLCHAHASKLDVPRATCQPAAGDKHLHDRSARPSGHEW